MIIYEKVSKTEINIFHDPHMYEIPVTIVLLIVTYNF